MTYANDNGRERLIAGFQSVFPDLSEADVIGATHEKIEAWDSMTSWLLLLAIQEEFSIVIGLDQIPKLDSFEAIERYLQKKVS